MSYRAWADTYESAAAYAVIKDVPEHELPSSAVFLDLGDATIPDPQHFTDDADDPPLHQYPRPKRPRKQRDAHGRPVQRPYGPQRRRIKKFQQQRHAEALTLLRNARGRRALIRARRRGKPTPPAQQRPGPMVEEWE